jgi:hypothetical protein
MDRQLKPKRSPLWKRMRRTRIVNVKAHRWSFGGDDRNFQIDIHRYIGTIFFKVGAAGEPAYRRPTSRKGRFRNSMFHFLSEPQATARK